MNDLIGTFSSDPFVNQRDGKLTGDYKTGRPEPTRSQAFLPLPDIHVSVRQNASQDDCWLTAEAVERRRRHDAFQAARHRDVDQCIRWNLQRRRPANVRLVDAVERRGGNDGRPLRASFSPGMPTAPTSVACQGAGTESAAEAAVASVSEVRAKKTPATF
jgi:hypothetical protein